MIDVHLNADLGEGLNIERDIMPFLSSCSIACGGHFGNYNSMIEAAEIAIQNKVKIGAHPSYPDKIGFGRKAMNISNEELSKSLIQQVNSLRKILDDLEYQHIFCHKIPHVFLTILKLLQLSSTLPPSSRLSNS